MCGWHRGRTLTLAAWPPLLLPSQYGEAGRPSTLAPLTTLETMVGAPGAGLTSTSVSVHRAASVLCFCAGDDAAARREGSRSQPSSQPVPPESRADRLERARVQAREKARGWVAWGANGGGGAAPTWCEAHLVRGGPMEEGTTWLMEAQLLEARRQLRAQPTSGGAAPRRPST